MKYKISLCFSSKYHNFHLHKIKFYDIFVCIRSYGVMVSTQDSESCDPSSNLGGTYFFQLGLVIHPGGKRRHRRDSNSDRWIQSPEC